MSKLPSLTPRDFQTSVTDVFVERLKANPDSMPDAFGVIWGICALSDHIAVSQGKDEKEFAEQMRSRSWQFRAIWIACNAAKHAVLRSSRDISGSGSIKNRHYDEYEWYFSGAEHCGDQVCIVLNWRLDQQTNTWTDGDGGKVPGCGPFFGEVPILDLVGPAMDALGVKPSVDFDAPSRYR